ncbi:serine/threonine-protein kinase [Aneurinibacillus sp. Ricciae_BoGa-3]|uniref:serine/threonine-protein kinase n=1 Tax=Aneurinibacillus sp. Ricciae_BoGa-3 TaxID=3022697 RepID=UPI002340A198|nr:serine/threonine-protein kinase [Aneurinibacillus sp. Ricciae_BoGa-3]WCK53911.1 serine/threonine-protein kinase [Aneurinibacillus sp. Ricciae_BoGa-3]
MLITPGTIVYDEEENLYEVKSFIGNGAFGHVYRIEKKDDQSQWALKTLPSTFASNSSVQSFINESKMAMQICHDNAISYLYVHDGQRYNNLPPYIIMEFAENGTLLDIIRNHKSTGEFISNGQLKDYFMQLINGMEHINSHIIHRDIKPDNILVQKDCLKVSDFGLSKIVSEQTRTMTFKGVGHIRYQAPEGWKMDQNTIQMDIYAMGIVFYELATLKHPLSVQQEGDIQAWRDAHLFQNPVSPHSINRSLTSVMNQVILKMMEKNTTQRFQTWDQIRTQLLKDDDQHTPNTTIVDNLINIRVQKDSAKKAKELEEQKKNEEMVEGYKLVHYQFSNFVYQPIKDLIEEFNHKYDGGQTISITTFNPYKMNNKNFTVRINLISGKYLEIRIQCLVDEDFYRDVPSYPFGNMVKKLCRPTLNNKKILAWGYLKDIEDGGFNIILVQNEGELYGEWYTLYNTNSGITNRPRLPQPFYFDFNEIEKELPLIYATHIYNTEVKPLQMDMFLRFLAQEM